MNIDLTITANNVLSLLLGIFAGFAPIIVRRYQFWQLTPKNHEIFGIFKIANEYVIAAQYYKKNELRYQAVSKWNNAANKLILNFCLEISKKSVYNLGKNDFKAKAIDLLNAEMANFTVFAFDERNIAKIYREKFGVYTIDLGLFRIKADLEGYLSSPNLTNKQIVWYTFTDIVKYLHLLPNVMQKQNLLNGELDEYENKLLMGL